MRGDDHETLSEAELQAELEALRAENAALRASLTSEAGELRFQALADSIDQMIWATQPDGYHDYYNARWYEFTGMPAGSTDGEAWNGMFHPDDQEQAWTTWRHSLATGEPYHIEYRLRHRSGQYRWVLGRARPVRGPSGEIARWYGTCTDIHDLKTAQDRLEASETRLSRALTAGRIGDYAMDLTTGEISWSENLMRIVGLPLDTHVTQETVYDLIHPADRDFAREAVRAAIEDGMPIDMRYRVRGEDGTVRWIGSRGEVERAPDGTPLRIVGVNFDTTEQERVDSALREQEERLRIALSAGRLGDWTWDAASDAVSFAPDAAAIFGVDPGRSITWTELQTDVLLPEDAAMAAAAVAEAIASGGDYAAEYRVRRADGIAWVAAQGRIKLVNGQPTGLIGVVRDITAERSTQAALAASADAANREAAERSAILSQLTEGVIIADREGRITFVNEAAERLHGTKLLGVGPTEYAHRYHLLTEDGEPFPTRDLPLTRAVLHGETVIDARWRIRRPDGTEIVAIGTARPIFDPAGEPMGAVLTIRDDTERRAAEAALAQSQQRLTRALSAGRIGDFEWDLDTGAISWSDNLADIVQLDPSTPVDSDTVFGLMHEEDRAATSQALAHAIATGEPFDMRFRIRGTDGKLRWIASRGEVDRDPEGVARRVVGVNYDVSSIIEAEEALRESEARLRALTDNLPTAMVYQLLSTRDMSWRQYTYASGSCEKLTGVTPAEVLANPAIFQTVLPEAEWPRVFEEEVTAAASLSTFDLEVPIVRRDGVSTTIRLISEPRELPDGRLIWDGLMLDVTEQKERDAALSKRSTQLQALATAALAVARTPDLQAMLDVITQEARSIIGAHQAVISLTRDANWSQSINAMAVTARYGGYDDYDALTTGAGIYAWVCEENRPARLTQAELEAHPRWRAFSGDERHPPMRGWLAAPLVGRDGRNLGLIQLSDKEDDGDFDEADEAMLVQLAQLASAAIEQNMADATLRELNETLESRVAEEIARRAETEEALRQAQKMEMVGQLTGGIAHDFNNLLQVVTGNLDLLIRGLPADPPRLKRSAENAMKGAARAATLTQRLLAFSRRQPLAPKPVDVTRLIGGMSELLRRTLGETVEVRVPEADGLWQVEVDAHQLENALLNLAVNARDAMPEGGCLTIETANADVSDAGSQPPEVAAGDYVIIAVSDTGVGMDEDTVARAFEPFFTTKEVGKGTGLGLSMVYGFVKQSGGHLLIDSTPGAGTTIRIYLPRLVGRRAVEEGDAETAAAPKGRAGETVLVCEDDPDVRTFTTEVLRELGYHVLEAQDGPSAVAVLESGAEIDLLFTDVVLPSGMTGEEVARRAAELRPGLKVLFTTGYARNAVVHHGRLDPGVELLTKPFAYADLAARVREMLDRA